MVPLFVEHIYGYMLRRFFRKTPLVVSTGMSDWNQVVNIHKMLQGHEGGFALLQCTSCYPTPPECLNLNVIDKYREAFPDIVIGYSGMIRKFYQWRSMLVYKCRFHLFFFFLLAKIFNITACRGLNISLTTHCEKHDKLRFIVTYD